MTLLVNGQNKKEEISVKNIERRYPIALRFSTFVFSQYDYFMLLNLNF